MGNPRIVTIGAHQIELEEGFVVIRWQGQPSLEDTRQVFGRMHEHRAGRACFFLLADVRKCETLDARVRRWVVDWLRAHPLSGQAYIGTSLPQRAMLLLMSNVVRLLERRQPQVRIFDTEDEARAWIAQELARQAGP